ncbi:hypothetical protein QTO34_005802 [Cnephaeus nilssonii]|uniref:Uncharacterized protein n=1 Tax=Cnephaeus nilssonii TaxID=3371016 RepID=A0AA40LIW6_CNENI|nr:hypothetical protein QTO34_005802 [Eptesicus nilssonii]
MRSGPGCGFPLLLGTADGLLPPDPRSGTWSRLPAATAAGKPTPLDSDQRHRTPWDPQGLSGRPQHQDAAVGPGHQDVSSGCHGILSLCQGHPPDRGEDEDVKWGGGLARIPLQRPARAKDLPHSPRLPRLQPLERPPRPRFRPSPVEGKAERVPVGPGMEGTGGPGKRVEPPPRSLRQEPAGVLSRSWSRSPSRLWGQAVLPHENELDGSDVLGSAASRHLPLRQRRDQGWPWRGSRQRAWRARGRPRGPQGAREAGAPLLRVLSARGGGGGSGGGGGGGRGLVGLRLEEGPGALGE